MIDHALVREVVERHGVAVAAARRLGNVDRRSRFARLGDIPAGQQIVVRTRRRRPGAVGIAPYLIDPVDDPAVRVERGFGAREHGRAVRLPAELVVAHPLQAHRPSGDGAAQQRGIEGHVVGAVVPVAARALEMHAADRVNVELECLGEVAPERKDAVRMGPYRQCAVLVFGNRANGPIEACAI